jgi:hypothetical protein
VRSQGRLGVRSQGRPGVRNHRVGWCRHRLGPQEGAGEWGTILSRLYQLQRVYCRYPSCPQRPPEEVRKEVSGGPGDPLQRVQGLILGTFDFYSRGLQWVPP